MVARRRWCCLHPGPSGPAPPARGRHNRLLTALPDRSGTRVLARSLAGLAPLVMAGGLVLLAFNARVMSPTRIGVYVFAVVAVVVYAGIGD
jgi:hypothetical protein